MKRRIKYVLRDKTFVIVEFHAPKDNTDAQEVGLDKIMTAMQAGITYTETDGSVSYIPHHWIVKGTVLND